ncbi:hypothetical protein GJ496_008188 [Pomphorhynchus laevis]|nr:hypothetical protein GJ496_008188 [Pomphorhynchus laevis]
MLCVKFLTSETNRRFWIDNKSSKGEVLLCTNYRTQLYAYSWIKSCHKSLIFPSYFTCQIIKYLTSTFRAPLMPPNIYICSPLGSDIESLLLRVFSKTEVKHVRLNASAMRLQLSSGCSHTEFFSCLQRQIFRHLGYLDNHDYRKYITRSGSSRPRNFLEIFNNLKKSRYNSDSSTFKCVIMVTNAHRLHFRLLLMLMKGADDFYNYVDCNVGLHSNYQNYLQNRKSYQLTVLTIGQSPLDYIALKYALISRIARRTISISLPALTKTELSQTIIKDYVDNRDKTNDPHNNHVNQLREFARSVVSTHYPTTRNILDIRLAAYSFLGKITNDYSVNFNNNNNKENKECSRRDITAAAYSPPASKRSKISRNDCLHINHESIRRLYLKNSSELNKSLRLLAERRLSATFTSQSTISMNDNVQRSCYDYVQREYSSNTRDVVEQQSLTCNPQQTKQHDPYRLELPYYLKIMLVSAFIAGRNAVCSDNRIFKVEAFRLSCRRNVARQQTKKHNMHNILARNYNFTFNRLMSICCSVDVNNHIGFDRRSCQAGLALLESLNLISRSNQSRTFASTSSTNAIYLRRDTNHSSKSNRSWLVSGDDRFICNIDFELISQITNSLQLNLENLLEG